MDTTHRQELLRQLETADPAEAADPADELTAALARALDGPAEPVPADPISAGPSDSGDGPS